MDSVYIAEAPDTVSSQSGSVSKSHICQVIRKTAEILAAQGVPCCECSPAQGKVIATSQRIAGAVAEIDHGAEFGALDLVVVVDGLSGRSRRMDLQDFRAVRMVPHTVPAPGAVHPRFSSGAELHTPVNIVGKNLS